MNLKKIGVSTATISKTPRRINDNGGCGQDDSFEADDDDDDTVGEEADDDTIGDDTFGVEADDDNVGKEGANDGGSAKKRKRSRVQKKRGPERCNKLSGEKPIGERIRLDRDDTGVYIGIPSTQFSSFLGLSLRQNIPLSLNVSWNKLDFEYKRKLWEVVKMSYEFEDDDYHLVMKHVGSMIKNWRTTVLANIKDIQQKVRRKQIKLGPKEDILRRAIGKLPPSSRVLIGGFGATKSTFFGRNKRSVVYIENATLRKELAKYKSMYHEVCRKSGVVAEQVEQSVDQTTSNMFDTNPNEIMNAGGQHSHNSSYHPDLTLIYKLAQHEEQDVQSLGKSENRARHSVMHDLENRGDDMLRTPPATLSGVPSQQPSPQNPEQATRRQSPNISEEGSHKSQGKLSKVDMQQKKIPRPLGGVSSSHKISIENFNIFSCLESQPAENIAGMSVENIMRNDVTDTVECWLKLDTSDWYAPKAIYHGDGNKGQMLHNRKLEKENSRISVTEIGLG
ncbi:hypothetical protein ACFE04_011247 [Oxalis oulophora]